MTQVQVRTEDGTAINEWFDLPQVPGKDDEITVPVDDAAGTPVPTVCKVERVRWEPTGTTEQTASHVVLTVKVGGGGGKPDKDRDKRPHPWKP
jgi:hypothetical protein